VDENNVLFEQNRHEQVDKVGPTQMLEYAHERKLTFDKFGHCLFRYCQINLEAFPVDNQRFFEIGALAKRKAIKDLGSFLVEVADEISIIKSFEKSLEIVFGFVSGITSKSVNLYEI
jgi:hypothetical protein